MDIDIITFRNRKREIQPAKRTSKSILKIFVTQTSSAPKVFRLFLPNLLLSRSSTTKKGYKNSPLFFYLFLSPYNNNIRSRNHHEFILNNDCQNSAAGSDVAAVVGPIPIPGLDTIPPSDTLPIPILTPLPIPIPVPDPPDTPEAGPGPEPDPGAEADPEVGAELAEAAVGETKEDTEGKEDEEGLVKGNAWRRRCSRSVRDADMCMCFFLVGGMCTKVRRGRKRKKMVSRGLYKMEKLRKRETNVLFAKSN